MNWRWVAGVRILLQFTSQVKSVLYVKLDVLLFAPFIFK